MPEEYQQDDYQQATLEMIEHKKRRAENGLESKPEGYYDGYKQAFMDFIINSRELPEM